MKIEFSKAKAYIQWAETNKRICWVVNKGIGTFNPFAIDDFLKDSNYTVIHN